MALNLDRHGHLADPADWSEAAAQELADITLGPDHWRVLAVVRDFHAETGIAPSMRPLVKLVGAQLGPELGTSIALMRLFPPRNVRGGSARLVALIAGLPVPEGCL